MNSEFKLSEKLSHLEIIANDFPGVIIVHRLEGVVAEYMSPRGLLNLGLTMEELKNMDIQEYYKRYFNPDDADDYSPKVISLIEKGDDNEIVSFFQQVRSSPDRPWTWHMSSTKIFHKNEEGIPTYIITFACPVDPLHHVTAKVNRLLEENNFLRKNHHIFASLTKREKEILKAMAKGENSEDIAEKLYISETTVSTHRRNIRAKLQVESQYEIVRFAQAFDLI